MEWIDVSSNNGENIRGWLPICDGVIVKATQGAGYVNPYHDSQVAQARAAGKRIGHYHWAEPWLHSARQEADHFLAHAKLQPGDLIAWDVEDGRQPPGDVSPWVNDCLSYVELHAARTPLVYSFSSYLTAHFPHVNPHFPLWLAAYQIAPPKVPAPYSSLALWQYTSNPLDRSRGDVPADAGAPAPAPVPQPLPPTQGESNPMYITRLVDHPHTFVTDGETQRWHRDPDDHNRTVWHIAANHGDVTVYPESVAQHIERPVVGVIPPELVALGFVPAGAQASAPATVDVDAVAKAVADVLAGRLAS